MWGCERERLISASHTAALCEPGSYSPSTICGGEPDRRAAHGGALL